MYRHVLVPVDCSSDSRRAAPQLAAFLAPLGLCQVTLVASVSPSFTEAQRTQKTNHAHEALQSIADIFLEVGVYTRRRIVEAEESGDLAVATAAESRQAAGSYDLVLLDSHFTRLEEFDQPCTGSAADRISAQVSIPILILPTRRPPAA